MRWTIAILSVPVALAPGAAQAHAAEQGFVLLLPTDLYIMAGGASVALTVAVLALLPAGAAARLFRPRTMEARPRPRLRHLTSTLAAIVLGLLVWQGLTGARDPLVNPLPLFVWTVWWVALVALQGLLGNHWRWTNPFTGPLALLRRLTGARAPLRYPRRLGHAPAVAGFLGFAGFLLADPAPADPARLAVTVGSYWAVTLAGAAAFGPRWLLRAEALGVLMRAYARLGLLGRARGRLALGLPGWQVLARPRPGPGLALFMLLILGGGSFDGLNETFWWLARLGLNPLEFPGRSAVIGPTLSGLVVANAALAGAFTACLWLGARLSRQPDGALRADFCRYAPTLLPIALGYHIAHYLTSFLVDGQYVLAFLDDPLARGHDLLGRGAIHVTTGFLSSPGPVRIIWLGQAGAVVAGHVIAILLAHALAVRRLGDHRRALMAQAPLAVFMIAYTVFGLWLLASPRGV